MNTGNTDQKVSGPAEKCISVSAPIFIMGNGRSGTTLMKVILHSHPQIAITHETHFLHFIDRYRRKLKSELPADLNEIWSRYTNFYRFQELEIDAGRCSEIMKQSGEYSCRSMFASVLTAFAEKNQKPRVGEKTPRHEFYLKTVLDWFPDASIIILKRDPRAVIASLLKTPWIIERMNSGLWLSRSRAYQIALASAEWKLSNEIMREWQHDDRVTVVQYERLVADPESEIRRVCKFLNVSFEPSMIGPHTENEVPTPFPRGHLDNQEMLIWRETHHARTREAVFTDSLCKWQQELTTKEVKAIEAICQRGMREAGYVFQSESFATYLFLQYRTLLFLGKTENLIQHYLRKYKRKAFRNAGRVKSHLLKLVSK